MSHSPTGTRKVASPLMVWAALLVIYLVWGSTYLAIRLVVESMPPFLAGGARFVTAGVIVAAFLIVRSGPSRMRITRAQLAGAAFV
ncbi:MAG: EamA family transporter, partial [Candidatus Limnocylindrales bacterium]